MCSRSFSILGLRSDLKSTISTVSPSHLVEQNTGHKVSRMHLYFTGETNGLPTISFNKNSSAIEHTIEDFDRIVGKIESKNYSLKARPDKTCVDCSARAYCDRKNWKFCG